jgi:hypothetical protein
MLDFAAFAAKLRCFSPERGAGRHTANARKSSLDKRSNRCGE